MRSRNRGGCFARGVSVAFSLGGCGLTPPPLSRRRASERARKRERKRGGEKDLLKRSNQRRRRKATGRRALPTPACAARWGQRDPCRPRRVEAGPSGPGAGPGGPGAGPGGQGGVSPGNPRARGARPRRPASWGGREGAGRGRRPRGMEKPRQCRSAAPAEEVNRTGQPLPLPPAPHQNPNSCFPLS